MVVVAPGPAGERSLGADHKASAQAFAEGVFDIGVDRYLGHAPIII
jgi:hypothetical protein